MHLGLQQLLGRYTGSIELRSILLHLSAECLQGGTKQDLACQLCPNSQAMKNLQPEKHQARLYSTKSKL